MSTTVGQQDRRVAKGCVAAEPATEFAYRRFPQRHRALLAALAVQVNARGAIEHHIRYTHADDLRDASTGVVEHGQQEMVALRRPRLTRLPEDCQHLLAREEPERWALKTLHGHTERPLDGVKGRDIAARRELQERSQCREPQVTAAYGVTTIMLQVIKEREDQIGLDVGEPQCRSGLTQPPGCEGQEQH